MPQDVTVGIGGLCLLVPHPTSNRLHALMPGHNHDCMATPHVPHKATIEVWFGGSLKLQKELNGCEVDLGALDQGGSPYGVPQSVLRLSEVVAGAAVDKRHAGSPPPDWLLNRILLPNRKPYSASPDVKANWGVGNGQPRPRATIATWKFNGVPEAQLELCEIRALRTSAGCPVLDLSTAPAPIEIRIVHEPRTPDDVPRPGKNDHFPSHYGLLETCPEDPEDLNWGGVPIHKDRARDLEEDDIPWIEYPGYKCILGAAEYG